MRLTRARVQNYRSIRDTGWFEVESGKTILVGPNESGKTAILQALQRLNAPKDVLGFDPLRDFPRSELNELDSGRLNAAETNVVVGEFALDADERALLAEIDEAFADCTYTVGRRLDNKAWHEINGGPAIPRYGDLRNDLGRLIAHVDARQRLAGGADPAPSVAIREIIETWNDRTSITAGKAALLRKWLEDTALPFIDENSDSDERRYDRLLAATEIDDLKSKALQVLWSRLPVFIYFNNYFRVRPLIHLEHLANRVEQKLLDDDQYDFGNLCLLKLLGFSARELSNLGKAAEPTAGDHDAIRRYRDQLDTRAYKLNAASVRLTNQIREVWQPDRSRGEADTLRLQADQQYLKVVVEDDLGVDIELDQRSEGFQWLVSFFVVFFAEAADAHDNAVLLLDEPGLSLHGLKQRDFRVTISRLAERNQTLFTTHSPFLVGPGELDAVRVVEMRNRTEGTVVHTSVTAEDPAALLPLQEALGYDLAQSLFAQQRNLVLEGLTDYWYVETTAALLRDVGVANLNERIAMIPANAAGKVVYFATILHAHNLKVAALLDSDRAGEQAATQDTLVHTLGNRAILRTRDAYSGPVALPEIEDLLRDSLVAIARDDAQLGWDVSALAAAQLSRPIVDVFKDSVGKDFSKYKLAKAYMRWARDHSANDLTDLERTAWIKLIDAINRALR